VPDAGAAEPAAAAAAAAEPAASAAEPAAEAAAAAEPAAAEAAAAADPAAAAAEQLPDDQFAEKSGAAILDGLPGWPLFASIAEKLEHDDECYHSDHIEETDEPENRETEVCLFDLVADINVGKAVSPERCKTFETDASLARLYRMTTCSQLAEVGYLQDSHLFVYLFIAFWTLHF
jgi:3-oxoacyl-ACP reductase-like protein